MPKRKQSKKVRDLKLRYSERFPIVKPSNIIPEEEGVSPFFVWISCGARGWGKTHSVLQMFQHIYKTRFYSRWILLSPTQESDLKQKALFDEIERSGLLVERYETMNEETLNQIEEDTYEYQEMWENYILHKDLLEKLHRSGIKALTDEEILFLTGFFDEDIDLSTINDEDILGQYPMWMRRDMPPTTMIFADDQYAERLMSKTRNNPLIKLVVNGRHRRTSLVMATQSIASIPRAIRSNTQIWSVFPLKAPKDLNALWEEVCGAFDDENHFKLIMDEVKRENHGFMFLDASSLKTPHLSIGFNNKIF